MSALLAILVGFLALGVGIVFTWLAGKVVMVILNEEEADGVGRLILGFGGIVFVAAVLTVSLMLGHEILEWWKGVK